MELNASYKLKIVEPPNKYVTINIRLIIRLLKATFGIKTRIKHADATKADKSFHNFRW